MIPRRKVSWCFWMGLLFAGCESAPDVPQPVDLRPDAAPTASAAERERVQQFWRVYRRATALRVAGDVEQAKVFLDSALTINPDHLDALYYGGNAAYELGQFKDAEQRWRREVEVNEHSARAHAQIGMLYSSGQQGAPIDLELARQQLEAAHRLNRAETGLLIRLGVVALLQADLQAAESWLAAASKTNAKSVAAVYLRGYLAWLGAERSAAQSFLDHARFLALGGEAEVSASAEGQTVGGRPLLESERTGALSRFWRTLSTPDGAPRTEDGSPATSVESERVAEAEYGLFHEALVQERRRLADLSASNRPTDG